MTALVWSLVGRMHRRSLAARLDIVGLVAAFLTATGAGVAASGLLRVAVVLVGVAVFVAACLRSPQRAVLGLLGLATVGTPRPLLPSGASGDAVRCCWWPPASWLCSSSWPPAGVPSAASPALPAPCSCCAG